MLDDHHFLYVHNCCFGPDIAVVTTINSMDLLLAILANIYLFQQVFTSLKFLQKMASA
jgi:hypothetical protein